MDYLYVLRIQTCSINRIKHYRNKDDFYALNSTLACIYNQRPINYTEQVEDVPL